MTEKQTINQLDIRGLIQLRFFQCLKSLKSTLGTLPLENSLLNRYRKYGIEFNVTAPGREPLQLYETEPKGKWTIRPRRLNDVKVEMREFSLHKAFKST